MTKRGEDIEDLKSVKRHIYKSNMWTLVEQQFEYTNYKMASVTNRDLDPEYLMKNYQGNNLNLTLQKLLMK